MGESDLSGALGSRASATSRPPADPFAFAAPTDADATSLRSAGTLSDTHPVQAQAKPQQQGDDPFLEMLWKGEQDAERISRPSAVSSAAPAPVVAAALSAQQPQPHPSSPGSVLSSRPDATPPSVVKSLNFDAAVSTVQLSSVGGGGGGGGSSALDTPLKLSELSAHDGSGGSPLPPSRDGSERSSQIPSKSYATRDVPTGLSVATSASTMVESPKTAGMLRKEVPSTVPSAHSSTSSARHPQPSKRSVSPPGPEKPSLSALSQASFASDAAAASASALPRQTPSTTRSVSPPAPDTAASLRAPSSVARSAASARSVSPPAPDKPASSATAASLRGLSHASLSSRTGGGVVAAASSAKPPAPPVSAASSHAAFAATQSQGRSVSPPAPARAGAPSVASVASVASAPQLRQQRSQVSSVPSAAAAAAHRRSISPPGPEKPASAATALGRPSAAAPSSSASGAAAYPARSVSPPRPPSSRVAAVPSAAASGSSVASFPAGTAAVRGSRASSRRSISPEAPERPQPAREAPARPLQAPPSSQGSVPVSPAAVRSVSPPRPASSVRGGGAEVYIPSPMTGLGLEGSRADSFRARIEPHLKSLPSALIRVEGREEELLDSCCAHNGVELELANAARDAVNSLRAAGASVAIDPAKTGLLRGLGLDVDAVFSDKECRVVAAAMWQLDHPPRETAAFRSVLDGFVTRLVAEFSRKQAKKAALEAAAAAQEEEDEQRRRALAPAVTVQQQQPQVYYGGRSPTRRTIPAPPQCFAQPQVLPPQYLNQVAVAATSALPPPPPQASQQQPVVPPPPVNIATAAYCQPAGGGPVPLFQPISPRYASMGERCRAEQLAFIKTRKPMPDTKATYPATRPTQKSVGTGPPETRAVSPTRNGEAGHPGDTAALWKHFGVEQHPYSHAQASYHDPASRRYPTTYDPRQPNTGGGGGGSAADAYDPSRPSVSYVTRMPKRMLA